MAQDPFYCQNIYISNIFYCILWDIQLHGRLLHLQMDEQKDFYNVTNLHGYTTVSFIEGYGKPNL
jgi:hypothetical protein